VLSEVASDSEAAVLSCSAHASVIELLEATGFGSGDAVRRRLRRPSF